MDIHAAAGRPRVVVGVDGSPGARAALVTALTTAAQRGATLDVVSAFPLPPVWTRGAPVELPDVEALRADTERRARVLVDEARAEQAGVPGVDDVEVRVAVIDGRPVSTLLDAAKGADLLVVGSRGRGAMRSALLGSVALHCIGHAPCPVTVVHATPAGGQPEERVVVGVDGSAGSRAAIAAAVEEAARTGAEVEVVSAFSMPDYWTDLTTIVVPTQDQVRDELGHRAEDLVGQVLAKRADAARVPTIRTRVVEGPAGEVLVDRSRDARTLVVGSHGHSTIQGLVVGSTALHCAMHADAPVTVVRPLRADVAPDSVQPESALADR